MSIAVPRCSTWDQAALPMFPAGFAVRSNGFIHARVLQRDRRTGALDNSLILLALPDPPLPSFASSGRLRVRRSEWSRNRCPDGPRVVAALLGQDEASAHDQARDECVDEGAA
jgi:hypothetical protein